jgi:hypothetical protein
LREKRAAGTARRHCTKNAGRGAEQGRVKRKPPGGFAGRLGIVTAWRDVRSWAQYAAPCSASSRVRFTCCQAYIGPRSSQTL